MTKLRIDPATRTRHTEPEQMRNELSDFCAHHPGANREIDNRIFEYGHDRSVCEKVGAKYERMNTSDILKIAYYALLLMKDEDWNPETQPNIF